MNSPELSQHVFEILYMDKASNGCWLAQYAIDGKKYRPFYEPCVNVHAMNTEEFEEYMKLQALTYATYWQEKESGAN